jgi:hypothetical protein
MVEAPFSWSRGSYVDVWGKDVHMVKPVVLNRCSLFGVRCFTVLLIHQVVYMACFGLAHVFSKTIANLALLGFTDNNRDINR